MSAKLLELELELELLELELELVADVSSLRFFFRPFFDFPPEALCFLVSVVPTSPLLELLLVGGGLELRGREPRDESGVAVP